MFGSKILDRYFWRIFDTIGKQFYIFSPQFYQQRKREKQNEKIETAAKMHPLKTMLIRQVATCLDTIYLLSPDNVKKSSRTT